MKTFSIDSDDNITVLASVEEAGAVPGVERFDSLDQFRGLAEHWPASRSVINRRYKNFWAVSQQRTRKRKDCSPKYLPWPDLLARPHLK
jgi:hypothetical protein